MPAKYSLFSCKLVAKKNSFDIFIDFTPCFIGFAPFSEGFSGDCCKKFQRLNALFFTFFVWMLQKNASNGSGNHYDQYGADLKLLDGDECGKKQAEAGGELERRAGRRTEVGRRHQQ